MTENEITELVRSLGGVEVVVASADNGAPEVAWDDSMPADPGSRRCSPRPIDDRSNAATSRTPIRRVAAGRFRAW